MTEIEKLFSKRKTTRLYIDTSVNSIKSEIQKDKPDSIIIQANLETLCTKLQQLDILQESIESTAETTTVNDLVQESFAYRTVVCKTKILAENFIPKTPK